MKNPLTDLRQVNEEELALLKKRVEIASAFVIIIAALLLTRLWYLQVLNYEDYSQRAQTNLIRSREITPPRGRIMDRQGRIMVTNRPCFNVLWYKEDARRPELIIKRLSSILDLSISDILEKVREASDQPNYVPILLAEDIDRSTLIYLENHKFSLPGVVIKTVPRRRYPHGNLASHLLGYLGQISKQQLQVKEDDYYKGGDLLGLTGIEKTFNNELRGEKGKRYLEVDSRGFVQRNLRVKKALPGNDLKLTIDVDLQKEAEKALQGRAGAICAMEVKTGRLLVLASSPPIEIQEFAGGISSKTWQDHVQNPLDPLTDKNIQGQYPPASTYKTVTALAGLSEEVITPETIIYCNGSMELHGRKYRCWKKRGHGATTLKKALSESCDVYFYEVGHRLGIRNLAKYARESGLGEKTGIALPGEAAGLVPDPDWKKRTKNQNWQEGETLSTAIGQGFNLTTPLQICRMTAAIAEGGTLYQPRLVEEIRKMDTNTEEKFSSKTDGKISASREILDLIKQGLVDAVNAKHGTGEQARLETITVAGKTGTAQTLGLDRFKALLEEDIPYKYKDHAWFTSFAPAEDPEIAVTVFVEHGSHGGSTAAPIARKILEKYFNIEEK
ncbi:MAG: penicillin-binding protein 2 [Desulfurivibrionaceae bacterium]